MFLANNVLPRNPTFIFNMKLQQLSMTPPAGLLEFLRDLGDGENGFGGSRINHDDFSLEDYLQRFCVMNDPDLIEPHLACQTNFWVIDDDEIIVGMLKIRHYLTELTRVNGGHIGYYIRSTHRGRGLGKLSLKLGLGKLQEFGVPKALITIYPENIASIKVTEAVGGIFEDTFYDEKSAKEINRYWIELKT
ncbi:GNAT family N-acetyltransferase [Opitutaceae bacterium]|nr:GNAT family N-acetyltransferase [Opitutaceae bacterium]